MIIPNYNFIPKCLYNFTKQKKYYYCLLLNGRCPCYNDYQIANYPFKKILSKVI